MPYKCSFGCTSYNPSCDACDSATEGNGYDENESHLKHKAALRGQTKEEYLASEENDD